MALPWGGHQLAQLQHLGEQLLSAATFPFLHFAW